MLDDIKIGVPTISESDIVALLGLHGSGVAVLNNSGFAGPWGPLTDLNAVNNNFYKNLINYGYPGANFNQTQAISAAFPAPALNLDGNYSSPAPAMNKIEWVHGPGSDYRPSGASPAKMMLPIDMQIYLSFTVNSTQAGHSWPEAGTYCWHC